MTTTIIQLPADLLGDAPRTDVRRAEQAPQTASHTAPSGPMAAILVALLTFAVVATLIAGLAWLGTHGLLMLESMVSAYLRADMIR